MNHRFSRRIIKQQKQSIHKAVLVVMSVFVFSFGLLGFSTGPDTPLPDALQTQPAAADHCDGLSTEPGHGDISPQGWCQIGHLVETVPTTAPQTTAPPTTAPAQP